MLRLLANATMCLSMLASSVGPSLSQAIGSPFGNPPVVRSKPGHPPPGARGFEDDDDQVSRICRTQQGSCRLKTPRATGVPCSCRIAGKAVRGVIAIPD